MKTLSLNSGDLFTSKPWFIMLIIIATLVGTIEHTTILYVQASQISQPGFFTWMKAIAINIVLDACILVFVTRGMHRVAFFYTCCLIVLQLYYYGGVNLLDNLSGSIPKIIFSFMYPLTIYILSKMHFDELQLGKAEGKLIEENENLIREKLEIIKQHDELVKKNEWLSLELERMNELNHTIQKQNHHLNEFKQNRIAELTCPDCGHIANNDFGVSGHIKGCTKRKDKTH